MLLMERSFRIRNETRFSLPLDEFPELPDSKPFEPEQELEERKVYYFNIGVYDHFGNFSLKYWAQQISVFTIEENIIILCAGAGSDYKLFKEDFSLKTSYFHLIFFFLVVVVMVCVCMYVMCVCECM